MFCFLLGPEDIDTLLEFTQHLKAFTNMTLSVRRALVATMVFAGMTAFASAIPSGWGNIAANYIWLLRIKMRACSHTIQVGA